MGLRTSKPFPEAHYDCLLWFKWQQEAGYRRGCRGYWDRVGRLMQVFCPQCLLIWDKAHRRESEVRSRYRTPCPFCLKDVLWLCVPASSP